MSIFLSILVIVAAILIFYLLVFKADELDEREEELDKYSIHLGELANKLARWEQELIDWEKEQHNEKGK